jgi:5-methyltetrahydropteroyltriglutamate--homocysteine methyltransferase
MQVSNLGYPRIGRRRELKTALEGFSQGKIDSSQLLAIGKKLCVDRWRRQKELGVDHVPLNDFSFSDHLLDMALLLGVVPERFEKQADWMALTRDLEQGVENVPGLGIRKWFNTNCHSFVPELSPSSLVSPRWEKLRFELDLAREQADIRFHPVLIGPWTFAKLSHISGMNFTTALERLIPKYVEILRELGRFGFDYVQMDEPSLCTDLVREDLRSLRKIYEALQEGGVSLQLATYYGSPESWLSDIVHIPCDGFHFDLLHWPATASWLKTRTFPRDKHLSLGIVSGRNVWASPLWDRKAEIQGFVDLYGIDRISIAPTCTLLHLPLDKTVEKQWDPEFSSWVSFADQRLEELAFLKRALLGDRNVEQLLKQRQSALSAKSVSQRVHRPEVKQAVARIEAKQTVRTGTLIRSKSAYKIPGLPNLPTTTVGAFPQTSERRKTRLDWKKGKLTDEQYKKHVSAEIESVIRFQERIGLDVLVIGDLERSDMVEYFAEHWDGVALSTAGWVQSIGSQCVRPPLIFGDVRRRSPAAAAWFQIAMSFTDKPLKAVVTGPVTLLNWSFVREDQSRQKSAFQIALALKEEVKDLEKAGAKIIQIDEPALREGLPMAKVHWNAYLKWALEAFQVTTSELGPGVQVHAHFCYSAYEDISDALILLGADVLLVECHRSGDGLLEKLSKGRFKGQIGPGAFDVRRLVPPTEEECKRKIEGYVERFSLEQVWVSPDCNLKSMTVSCAESSIVAMVGAAKIVRSQVQKRKPS